MKSRIPLVLALAMVLSVVPLMTGAGQPAEKRSLLGNDLQVGELFWFIRSGQGYGEQGFPGKLLAIDGQWVKVEEQLLNRRQIWINLQHVGAIWKDVASKKPN